MTEHNLSSRIHHLHALMTAAGASLSPEEVPADPFAYLAEKCRKEFLRAWHDEHGAAPTGHVRQTDDAIDTATEVYGEL